jgi:hypothetical protein
MWSYQRYRTWLESRKNWHIPGSTTETVEAESTEPTPASSRPQAFPIASKSAPAPAKVFNPAPIPAEGTRPPGRIEIEPTESEFGKILKRPGEQ